MSYYISKIQQALGIFGNPGVCIVVGIIILFVTFLIAGNNNTLAGTTIFIVIGIVLILAGLFGATGSTLWHF